MSQLIKIANSPDCMWRVAVITYACLFTLPTLEWLNDVVIYIDLYMFIHLYWLRDNIVL